jgi:hypothetical protein
MILNILLKVYQAYERMEKALVTGGADFIGPFSARL